MPIDWRNRVVLVTGGTSGIGLAIAHALRCRGATVAICARTAAKVASCVEAEGFADGFTCDVARGAEVDAMMDALGTRHGRLDLLVANTGGLEETDFRHAPLAPALLAGAIEANLTAPIQVVNAALPLLRRSDRPRIAMVGSGYGWSPVARAPLYAAGKAGIRAFVKALRMQLAPDRFEVLEIVPPAVDTPATAGRRVRKISPEAMADATLAAFDRGRKEAFAGQTRAIPLMLRLAPGLLERITGRG